MVPERHDVDLVLLEGAVVGVLEDLQFGADASGDGSHVPIDVSVLEVFEHVADFLDPG